MSEPEHQQSTALLSDADLSLVDKKKKKKKFKKKSKATANVATVAPPSTSDLLASIKKLTDRLASVEQAQSAKDTPAGKAQRVSCSYCKIYGHHINECRKRKAANDESYQAEKRGRGKANLAIASTGDSSRTTALVARHVEKPMCCIPSKTHSVSIVSANALLSSTKPNPLAKKFKMKMFVDSGASSHMVKPSYSHLLLNVSPVSTTVTTAGGELHASCVGNLPVNVASDEHVLPVPGLTENLYSINQATSNGRIAVLTNGKFQLFEPHQVVTHGSPVLEGKKVDNMYEIELSHNTGLTTSDCATALIADVKPTNKALLWHNRLNHCSKSVLKRFNKYNGSNLFTKKEFKEFSLVLCSGCALGKMTLAPVPRLLLNYRKIPSRAS